jgi:hypothetical protein
MNPLYGLFAAILCAGAIMALLLVSPTAGPRGTLWGLSPKEVERRSRRYWISTAIAVLAMVLVDTQSLNPLAKYTASLYLIGKTMAAAASWYLVVKLFFPYSDLGADMSAAREAFSGHRGDLRIDRSSGAAANVIASALIRVAAAILVASVWSTV